MGKLAICKFLIEGTF